MLRYLFGCLLALAVLIGGTATVSAAPVEAGGKSTQTKGGKKKAKGKKKARGKKKANKKHAKKGKGKKGKKGKKKPA